MTVQLLESCEPINCELLAFWHELTDCAKADLISELPNDFNKFLNEFSKTIWILPLAEFELPTVMVEEETFCIEVVSEVEPPFASPPPPPPPPPPPQDAIKMILSNTITNLVIFDMVIP